MSRPDLYESFQQPSFDPDGEYELPRPGWFVRHTVLSTGGAVFLILSVISFATSGGGRGGERAASRGAVDRPPGPARAFGDGTHVVGKDIPVGTYVSAGARSGSAAFCSVTTESRRAEALSRITSGRRGERVVITLSRYDSVVTVQGCEPLTRRR